MQRHPLNPLITADMVPPTAPGYRVRGAFNPAAIRYGEETLLLLRVAEDVESPPGEIAMPVAEIIDGVGHPRVRQFSLKDPDVRLEDTRSVFYRGSEFLSTMSHLRLARSRDGVNFEVDEHPLIFPSVAEERFGCEDARIVQIEDTYYINYTAVSPDGWATALASTRDFQTVTRHGLIFAPLNKDVCLFPEKIGGLYRALHRPHNERLGRPSIWYADSPDLKYWGNYRCLITPRESRWESEKIGGGAPCIKTPRGWLQLYHGKGDGQVYSLFTLLLDLEDPSQVIQRATEPFLIPEAPYETAGFFPGVVFTNGVIADEDGTVRVYYGAADGCSCLVTTSVDELLATL